MIEILPSPDHVAAFRMSGTLSGDDFDHITAVIEEKLARHRRIGVVADMTGFQDLTPEALSKDLRYGFSKFGEWSRFPREAVVTDKQWVRALMKTFGPLVPQVELRVFEPGEQDAALAWAAEVKPD